MAIYVAIAICILHDMKRFCNIVSAYFNFKLQDILDKTYFWSGIDIDDCLAIDIAKIQQKAKQMYECIQKISI